MIVIGGLDLVAACDKRSNKKKIINILKPRTLFVPVYLNVWDFSFQNQLSVAELVISLCFKGVKDKL